MRLPFPLLLLALAGCGAPIPPPHVVRHVNLTADQRRIADSLFDLLLREHGAVPDTFSTGPEGLRVVFLRAPFAPWEGSGCVRSYVSAIPARPIARAVWEAMAPTMPLERLILVARSPGKSYGSWFRSVSCGGATVTLNFSPRDFAPSLPAE